MAKRTKQALKKGFNFDFESLLLSDQSQENHSQNSAINSSKFSKKPKIDHVKPTSSKTNRKNGQKIVDVSGIENEETEEFVDTPSFLKTIGNDINKFVEIKKNRMGHFTESVLSMYETKIVEMINRHEAEIEDLKKQATKSIEEQIKKCEEECIKLRQQENKLMKILEQQLKMVQKASVFQSEFVENFKNQHKNLFQAFKELRNKHKNEALDMNKSAAADLLKLQNKFLVESKKEEIQTLKKYISSFVF